MHLDCNNSNLESARLCQLIQLLYLRRHYIIKCGIVANLFLPYAGVNLERVLKVKTSL